jgi:hypothetical protein
VEIGKDALMAPRPLIPVDVTWVRLTFELLVLTSLHRHGKLSRLGDATVLPRPSDRQREIMKAIGVPDIPFYDPSYHKDILGL